MLTKLIPIILLVFSIGSYACDTVELGALTYHFQRVNKDWNEKNKTFGCHVNDWRFRYFENSYYWDTFAISKDWLITGSEKNISFHIEAGVMKGYRDELFNVTNYQIAPLVVPRFKYKVKDGNYFNIYLMPPLAFTLTYSFDLN